MGRFCNAAGGNFTIPDMYCFSASGTHNFGATNTSPRYFSVDNGVTNLKGYTISTGPPSQPDPGDWVGGATPSPFDATATSGVTVNLQSYDLTMIDVLGYSSQ